MEWMGTTLSVKATETDSNTIALHESVCRVFSSDPPGPAARSTAIQAYTAQYASFGVRCNGYCGIIESVTPNDKGWKAVTRVSPSLVVAPPSGSPTCAIH